MNNLEDHQMDEISGGNFWECFGWIWGYGMAGYVDIWGDSSASRYTRRL